VAREAAVMVLKDDAFPTIVAAMREGRVIFDNLRKFVIYLMSCNLSEVLIVVIAVGAGLPSPLLPLQILFLNLVTDVFPAFALGFGRGGADVMARPPRDPAEPIVTRAHWAMIAGLGGLITLATLGTFLWALLVAGLAPGQGVTVAFVTLALAQLWNVLNLRDPESGVLRNDVTENPWVWAAIALCILLIGAALFVPPLAEVLRLSHPGLPALLVALGGSLLPTLVWQVAMVLRRAGR
jgi:Ca2+-transporting ATPase